MARGAGRAGKYSALAKLMPPKAPRATGIHWAMMLSLSLAPLPVLGAADEYEATACPPKCQGVANRCESQHPAFRCPCAEPSDVRARSLPMSVRGAFRCPCEGRPPAPPPFRYMRGGAACLPAEPPARGRREICRPEHPFEPGLVERLFEWEVRPRPRPRPRPSGCAVVIHNSAEAERVAAVIHNSP